MKRNHISGLNIVIFTAAVPLLIFMCAAISLVSYLTFSSFDAATSRTARDAGTVRIRTIPDLAPVTNEPELHLAEVIEDSVPEPAIQTEVPPAAEAAVEPAVSAPAAPTGPLPVEEAGMVSEATAVQDEPVAPMVEQEAFEAAPPDIAAAGETQNEASPPVEDLPVVEVPAEPSVAEPVPPEVAPPQKEPPAPAAPSEPTFVPDSSFFDQLLDQVD